MVDELPKSPKKKTRDHRRTRQNRAKPNSNAIINSKLLKPRTIRVSKPSFITQLLNYLGKVRLTLFSKGQNSLAASLAQDSHQTLAMPNTKSSSSVIKLTVSVAGIALATLVPTLYPIGIAAAIYISFPTLLLYLRDARRGQLINISLIPLIVRLGLIFSGYLWLLAIGGIIGHLLTRRRLRMETDGSLEINRAFGELPKRAWILVGDAEVNISLDEIKPGDRAIVKSGEVIPIDAVVESGEGQIDCSVLTGESQPIEVGPGVKVFATTVLIRGRIILKVETAGYESIAAKINVILNETQDYRHTIIDRGRAAANRAVVPGLAVGGALGLMLGPQAAIISTMAIPGMSFVECSAVSILTYLQLISSKKILIKDGRIFESLNQIDTVIFDKTGTLTIEQPTVGKIHIYENYDEFSVLAIAAAAESQMEHPIANAIRQKAIQHRLEIPSIEKSSYIMGHGLHAVISGQEVYLGSAKFIESLGISLPDISIPLERAEQYGHGLVFIAINGYLAGIIEIQQTLRPEARQVIRELKSRGLKIVMISGDRSAPTKHIANQLGISEFFSNVLPHEKAKLVQNLQEEGRFVCFVGDGINDTIALKTAEVSISFKGATSAASDIAQIVLMTGSIYSIVDLFTISDKYRKTLSQNFVLALITSVSIFSGMFILNFGLVAASLTYYAGIITTMINSTRPLYENDNQDIEELIE